MDSNKKNNSPEPNTITTINPKGQIIHIGVEQIKNKYIVEGSSPEELASAFNLPVVTVEKLILDNSLEKLRAAHIKHGLAKLQNIQLSQAEKLLNIENQFKRIRILQLEKSLEDYVAYYSKYSHLYKVHPITGEVLKDINGIPIQIKIPNIARELSDLKESFTLSEGLKNMLNHIDDIINNPKDSEKSSQDVIDVDSFHDLFERKKPEDRD